MAIDLESYVWTDRGIRPTEGDESYTAGEQPVAEYDNWTNWAITTDLRALTDEVNGILSRLPDGSGPIDDLWVSKTDPVIEGTFDVNGNDIIDSGRTIYNSTNQYIQQSALQNEDIEITAGDHLSGGGQVRLGRTTRLDVDDDFLPYTGGTMEGTVEMDRNEIRNAGTVSLHTKPGMDDADLGHLHVGTGWDGANGIWDRPATGFAAIFHNNFSVRDDQTYAGRRPAIGFMASDSQQDHVPGTAISYTRDDNWSYGTMSFEAKTGDSPDSPLARVLTIADGEVRGENGSEFTGFRLENRTNRPAGAQPGRLIYRSDRD